MSTSEHAHNTVVEQQREIASLRRANTALHARASHLHTRLLTALDTLDSLQSSHASELNALHHANAMVERRLSSVAELLKETIDERDDLRDAVERFIEKLELAEGFYAVPVSRFSTAYLLDPLSPRSPESHDGQPGKSGGSLTPALVQTLQAELAREKEEHRHTWREAAAQIAALRAQVARRDAELGDLTLWGFESNDLAEGEEPSQPTRKEVRTLRVEANKRRRDLDREVRKLNTQLEDSRRRRAKQFYSPPLKPSRGAEFPLEQETRLSPRANPTQDLREPLPPEPCPEPQVLADPRPSTPTGPTHKSANSQTQTHLTAAIFTTTPLKSGPNQQGMSSMASTAGRKIPDVFLPATPPTRTPQSSDKAAGVSSEVACILEDLDHKIQALAEVMETFKAERANLLGANPEPAEAVDVTALESDLPNAWLLEEECIRLLETLKSNRGAPSQVAPSPPSFRQSGHQTLDTPVRRSSNAHVTEIAINQGTSPITSKSHLLLSPAGTLSIHDEERDREQATTSIPSAIEAVYSSTEDDYHEDTGSTNSLAADSTDLDTVGVDQASNSADPTPAVSDRPTLDLEETLRFAQEELHYKDEEMKGLIQEMERLRSRISTPQHSQHSPSDVQATHTSRPPLSSRNTQ